MCSPLASKETLPASFEFRQATGGVYDGQGRPLCSGLHAERGLGLSARRRRRRSIYLTDILSACLWMCQFISRTDPNWSAQGLLRTSQDSGSARRTIISVSFLFLLRPLPLMADDAFFCGVSETKVTRARWGGGVVVVVVVVVLQMKLLISGKVLR